MIFKSVFIGCMLCAGALAFHAGQAFARPNSNASGNPGEPRISATPRQNPAAAQSSAAELRDGQHDFDPLIGSWKYHLKRRLNPLTGSNAWVELEGTGTCIKVWDRRADAAFVQSSIAPVESLLGQQQGRQHGQRSAADWGVQEWPRGILCAGHTEWEGDLCAIRLVGHEYQFASL